MPDNEERRRESDKVLNRLESKIDRLVDVQTDMYAKQAVISSVLSTVKDETTKTNGRVTNLESWRDTKNGESKVICWAVGVVFAAVVAAWIKLVMG